MYIYDHQLQFQLPTSAYTSKRQHEIEVEKLLKPVWHVIGAKSDLPRDGAFLTIELLGEPLVVRNFGGTYHAFLNVCAHRHCELTSLERGHSEKFRCQYHGWEYDATGYTRHIPQARCFRPFDRANAHLHKFALETCGDILFVRIADEGPSLKEFLGDQYVLIQERFSEPWRPNWRWEYEYAANWKLPIENTLEAYHVEFVHTGVFGGTKCTEKCSDHSAGAGYSRLHYDVTENRFMSASQAWSARNLGAPHENVYTHHFIYPNLLIAQTDVIGWIQSYWPTSPTTSRTIIRMSSYRPRTWNPWKRWVGYITAWSGRSSNRKVQLEDANILARAQKGIASSRFPGCIGTIEERIFLFQEYIKRMCGDESGCPPETPEFNGDPSVVREPGEAAASK